MKKESMKIISVGGSIIIPSTGFDIEFLKKFRQMILSHVKKGMKFVLVIGGGSTCRNYQHALKEVVRASDTDVDNLGISVTKLNAEFVWHLFKEYAYEEIVINPNKKIHTSKSIIIACAWKPGFSTDMDSVLLAESYNAKEVINLSNIDYVFTKDPKKYKDAKPIKETDWKTYLEKVINYKWKPGANFPFDPIASKKAKELGLTVSILCGTKLSEVDKALKGKSFIGTIIK